MPVLKPVLLHLQKSHSSFKGNAVFLLSAKPLVVYSRNSNPDLRVVMSHSFLTGINFFSCSFSASARLWQLLLSPAKHSISWMVSIAAAQLYRLLTKAPRIFNASSKRRAHQPCITQLIRKQNVMQNLSVRRTHPGLSCLDHRGSCIALSSSPKYSVLHN